MPSMKSSRKSSRSRLAQWERSFSSTGGTGRQPTQVKSRSTSAPTKACGAERALHEPKRHLRVLRQLREPHRRACATQADLPEASAKQSHYGQGVRRLQRGWLKRRGILSSLPLSQSRSTAEYSRGGDDPVRAEVLGSARGGWLSQGDPRCDGTRWPQDCIYCRVEAASCRGRENCSVPLPSPNWHAARSADARSFCCR